MPCLRPFHAAAEDRQAGVPRHRQRKNADPLEDARQQKIMAGRWLYAQRQTSDPTEGCLKSALGTTARCLYQGERSQSYSHNMVLPQ